MNKIVKETCLGISILVFGIVLAVGATLGVLLSHLTDVCFPFPTQPLIFDGPL
jgi:hypothetical protein